MRDSRAILPDSCTCCRSDCPAGCEAASGRPSLFSPRINTNVYLDGFNLYYGCLKDTPYCWLDIGALCRRLLPDDTIHRIRYFTAFITTRPGDPPSTTQKRQRQQIYLRGLETIPILTLHTGHYLSRTKRRPLVTPVRGVPRIVEVRDTEEKGSDVNLATEVLVDAFDGDAGAFVLITNASDLKRLVKVIRQKFRTPVGVLNPHPTVSYALRQVASFSRQIRPGDRRACQFPSTLRDRYGAIHKPASW